MGNPIEFTERACLAFLANDDTTIMFSWENIRSQSINIASQSINIKTRWGVLPEYHTVEKMVKYIWTKIDVFLGHSHVCLYTIVTAVFIIMRHHEKFVLSGPRKTHDTSVGTDSAGSAMSSFLVQVTFLSLFNST